jgi:hypothetical protein
MQEVNSPGGGMQTDRYSSGTSGWIHCVASKTREKKMPPPLILDLDIFSME